MTSNAGTVDEYISETPSNRQNSLLKIREICMKYLPDHSEDMAYKMPSYKREGQVQVAFASQKQHICVYFLIHSVMLNNPERLNGINHGKGCLRFSNPNKVNYKLLTILLKETALSKDQIC
jgi:uncharacterized protein YdhG (YjbR/CyaY superfamily)